MYEKRQTDRIYPYHTLKQEKFIYKPKTKYIRLTEEIQQIQDRFFPMYHERDRNQTFTSFVLDEDLAVVMKGNNIVDLDEMLKEKSVCEKTPYKSFLRGEEQEDQKMLEPIQYEKDPKIANFTFGRAGFGRHIQSFKIESDTISKFHCKIQHLRSDSEKRRKYQKTIINILTRKTPLHSRCRKVTNQCWNLIFSFLRKADQYIVVDDQSRKGTFVQELGTSRHKLKQGFGYEFMDQNYIIYVPKVFTPQHTPNLSVEVHNQEGLKLIEEYLKEVNWCYYEKAKKSFVINVKEYRKLPKQVKKVSIIVLKIVYRDFHEFFCLAYVGDHEKRYEIGKKMQINVSPDEDDDFPSVHGIITCRRGQWIIESIHQESQHFPLWIRIPKQFYYPLNVKKQYRIRLAYTIIFKLNFLNF